MINKTAFIRFLKKLKIKEEFFMKTFEVPVMTIKRFDIVNIATTSVVSQEQAKQALKENKGIDEANIFMVTL
jgi:NACalpha-BTF3-like transcription factor